MTDSVQSVSAGMHRFGFPSSDAAPRPWQPAAMDHPMQPAAMDHPVYLSTGEPLVLPTRVRKQTMRGAAHDAFLRSSMLSGHPLAPGTMIP
jgi:hypothetical protein